eukprot:TRINITY_DN24924_c0_g1_i1.p1 TRINITY_DN24924_c0_g1~~TRINITY_DN24924_c0_g1_i1.p1  ORF type:complete len:246 (+),score=66.78 TRINITY_DN24924_c0_g1_i1:55-792(+)
MLRWALALALVCAVRSATQIGLKIVPTPPTTNCSNRESMMLESCETFATMCEGYGGTVAECTATDRGDAPGIDTSYGQDVATRLQHQPPRVDAECVCHGGFMNYTQDGDGHCWLVGECASPPTPPDRQCQPYMQETCMAEDYALCHSEGMPGMAAYRACLALHTTLEDQCAQCLTHYYTCMQDTARCDRADAQLACDDLVDEFQAAGANASLCNYFSACRCASPAGVVQPAAWAGVGVLLLALLH